MAPCVSLIAPRADLAQVARVTNAKGCTITHDRRIGDSLIVMRGGVDDTRIRLPRDSRPVSALNLRTPLLVLQACFDTTEAFALEVRVSHGALQSTRLIVGTHIKDARQEVDGSGVQYAMLPLIVPRGRMVQIIFHVSGIVEKLFRLAPFKAIESVALAGTGKIRLLSAGTSEQACIESTPPHMLLFAVPAYTRVVWSSAPPLPQPPSSLSEGKCHSSTTVATTTEMKQQSMVDEPRGRISLDVSLRAGGDGGACERGLPCQLMGSATPSSTTSSGCHSSARSATASPSDASTRRTVPMRLKPLTPGITSMSGSGDPLSRTGGRVIDEDSVHRTNARTSLTIHTSPRHKKCTSVHYIRLVDGEDGDVGGPGSSTLPTSGATSGGGSDGHDCALQRMSNSPQPAAYSACRLRKPFCEAHSMTSCSPEANTKSGTDLRSTSLVTTSRERGQVTLDIVSGWETGDGGGVRNEGTARTLCCARDKSSGAPLATNNGPTTTITGNGGGTGSSCIGNKQQQSGVGGNGCSSSNTTDGQPRARRRRNEGGTARSTMRLRDGKSTQSTLSTSPATVVSEGVDANDSVAAASLVVARRRQRARRRLRLLRANERQHHGAQLTRFLAASELPLSGEPTCADEDSIILAADAVQLLEPEPKCGYGFGYLGVLRDDGEYEIDEAANLQLKGALSLRLSDEDE